MEPKPERKYGRIVFAIIAGIAIQLIIKRFYQVPSVPEKVECPASVLLKEPCYIVTNAGKCSLECNGTQAINLAKILKDFTSGFKIHHQKLLDHFILGNTGIDTLPANVFGALGFTEINLVGATALKRIHRDAFKGLCEHEATEFTIYQTPVTQYENDKYSLFDAIKSLQNLHRMFISGTQITRVPSGAVHSLAKLGSIVFHTNPITKIDKLAFKNLPSLHMLSFQNNPIKDIGDQAFAVGDSRDPWIPTGNTKSIPLDIELSQAALQSSGIHSVSFLGIQRTVALHVKYSGLDFVDEGIYGPFLRENRLNTIHTDINCADSRNDWLREEYPDQWQDSNCKVTKRTEFK